MQAPIGRAVDCSQKMWASLQQSDRKFFVNRLSQRLIQIRQNSRQWITYLLLLRKPWCLPRQSQSCREPFRPQHAFPHLDRNMAGTRSYAVVQAFVRVGLLRLSSGFEWECIQDHKAPC